MAERMEVGFAGWKVHQMGLGPGGLLRLRIRTEASEIHGNLKKIWCKPVSLFEYMTSTGTAGCFSWVPS